MTWRSKRQSTMAMSTIEAEYMAAAAVAREIIWLHNLLQDLGIGASTLRIYAEAISLRHIISRHAQKLSADMHGRKVSCIAV